MRQGSPEEYNHRIHHRVLTVRIWVLSIFEKWRISWPSCLPGRWFATLWESSDVCLNARQPVSGGIGLPGEAHVNNKTQVHKLSNSFNTRTANSRGAGRITRVCQRDCIWQVSSRVRQNVSTDLTAQKPLASCVGERESVGVLSGSFFVFCKNIFGMWLQFAHLRLG